MQLVGKTRAYFVRVRRPWQSHWRAQHRPAHSPPFDVSPSARDGGLSGQCVRRAGHHRRRDGRVGAVTRGVSRLHDLRTEPRSNQGVGVNVSGAITTGAINNSVSSATPPKHTTSTSSIADLDLGGGVITAQALTATSTTQRANNVTSSSGDSTFVNLMVNGTPFAADQPPNTKVALPGLGSVTFNEQITRHVGPATIFIVRTGAPAGERLNPAGLPVGADIIVANENSQLTVSPGVCSTGSHSARR